MTNDKSAEHHSDRPDLDDVEADEEIDGAQLLRTASALQTTLEELRRLDMDGDGASLAARAYNSSLEAIRDNVPRELVGELNDVALPIDANASLEASRLAHARLVGWLQGMFQGMQASMMLQESKKIPPAAVAAIEGRTSDRSNTYL